MCAIIHSSVQLNINLLYLQNLRHLKQIKLSKEIHNFLIDMDEIRSPSLGVLTHIHVELYYQVNHPYTLPKPNLEKPTHVTITANEPLP